MYLFTPTENLVLCVYLQLAKCQDFIFFSVKNCKMRSNKGSNSPALKIWQIILL